MKSAGSIATILILAASALPQTVHAQETVPPSRPTVAVLDFDFTAAQERVVPGQRPSGGRSVMPNIEAMNLGKGIADLLVAELVNSGDLRVIERQRMAEVAREQQGGDAPKARYLVMGAVTRFSGEQKNKAAAGVLMGLVGLATHTPMMGAVSVKENVATVDLSCRIVDTSTGEIVGTASGAGVSHRRGLGVGGFGGGGRGAGGGGFNAGSSDFQATILGEATGEAVKEAAATLRAVLLKR